MYYFMVYLVYTCRLKIKHVCLKSFVPWCWISCFTVELLKAGSDQNTVAIAVIEVSAL